MEYLSISDFRASVKEDPCVDSIQVLFKSAEQGSCEILHLSVKDNIVISSILYTALIRDLCHRL